MNTLLESCVPYGRLACPKGGRDGDIVGDFYNVTMTSDAVQKGRIFKKGEKWKISGDIYNDIKDFCIVNKNYHILHNNEELGVVYSE